MVLNEYFHIPTGGTAGSESEGMIPRSMRLFFFSFSTKIRRIERGIIPMQLNRSFQRH
jgi:hypothetical protein